MKPFYKNLKFIAFGILTFFTVGASNIFAQTSISSAGVSITQNFSNFNPAGDWTNGTSPLPNWYALNGDGSIPTTFILNDGEYSTAGLTSFGSVSDSDRALGFAPAENVGEKMYVAWRLKNNTGVEITSLSVDWVGEQWRDDDFNKQTIALLYEVSASPITTITPATLQTTTSEFSSPNYSATGKLDGNFSNNRTAISTNISTSIPNGSEILIVFQTTDWGINHLLAIDDISVTARIPQTITFVQPTTKTYGEASFSSNASTNSGLPLSIVSANTNVATISGSTINIVGPGTSAITVSQAGNGVYLPASVSRTLTVNPHIPTVIKATDINTTSFQANWTIDNGLNDASTQYRVQINSSNNFVGIPPKGTTNKYYSFTTLTPNSIYYYRVYAINSGASSSYSQASAITTGTDYATDTDGEWSNVSNWDINGIYHIANSITINNIINLDKDNYPDSVVTNKLFIKSGAKLTSDQKIYVLNELIIEVDENGVAGQILNTANIVVGSNAKVTVRKTFASGEWAFMGFPFNVNAADVHIANTETTLSWGDLNGSGDYVVQQYDGASRASLNLGNPNYTSNGVYWKNVSPKVFTAKKGYIVYNNSGNDIDFSTTGNNIGTFFSRTGANVSTGRYNSTSEHAHWNLVTSPFSSIYDLAYTSPSTSYYAYNGTNYLPALAGEELDVQPFSAFFLQAPSTSIGFNNLVEGQGRKVAALSRSEEVPVDDIRLILSNGITKYDDMTRIRLLEGASADYEIGNDAVKMFGMNPKVSYIYTATNKATLAINTLPKTVTEVELKTKYAAAGKYSISISNIEKVQNYAAVILVDNVTGKRTDLLSVGNYEYSVNAPGTINRFKVQLAPKISTGLSVSDDYSLQVNSQQGYVLISGLKSASQVRIFDTTGKVVFGGIVNNNEPIRLTNKGLYIFEISTPDSIKTIKSYVR